MSKIKIKYTVENLIDTFLNAGKISLELRDAGLTKKIKNDNTPVTNGDIEVNKIISKKYPNLLQIFQLFLRKLLITSH